MYNIHWNSTTITAISLFILLYSYAFSARNGKIVVDKRKGKTFVLDFEDWKFACLQKKHHFVFLFLFFFSFTNNKLLYIKYNVLSSKSSIFECVSFFLSVDGFCKVLHAMRTWTQSAFYWAILRDRTSLAIIILQKLWF